MRRTHLLSGSVQAVERDTLVAYLLCSFLITICNERVLHALNSCKYMTLIHLMDFVLALLAMFRYLPFG